MLRALVGAAVLVVLLGGAAQAQLPFIPRPEPARSRENALQQAESERVHQQTLRNMPDRKASKDPWHSVRTAPQNPTPDRHRVE